jgi:hypothetical protein
MNELKQKNSVSYSKPITFAADDFEPYNKVDGINSRRLV